jgi:hypothetical protein
LFSIIFRNWFLTQARRIVMYKLISVLMIAGLLFSTQSFADGHRHGHHGHHYHGHRPHGHFSRYYAPAPVIYPAPVRYYQAPPVTRYVPAPPVYGYGYDRRTAGGLIGGVAGSAMGYQWSGGDPLAAGLGAAAGSWMGNGFSR